eukprot:TRINITY_DN2892_c0_g1_i1.p1 TRINITY_DN2892_c0_g1~~TRINITY_DN2892_c0_g1_i1.p1  ORF type:complete len:160 (-),score=9.34 TRINITY_DN2892_c0_g1_i1:179-595(-)
MTTSIFACLCYVYMPTFFGMSSAVVISEHDEVAAHASSHEVHQSVKDSAPPYPVYDSSLAVSSQSVSSTTPEGPPTWMVQEPLIPVNGVYPGQAPPQPIDRVSEAISIASGLVVNEGAADLPDAGFAQPNVFTPNSVG